jgi:hypothetical protein
MDSEMKDFFYDKNKIDSFVSNENDRVNCHMIFKAVNAFFTAPSFIILDWKVNDIISGMYILEIQFSNSLSFSMRSLNDLWGICPFYIFDIKLNYLFNRVSLQIEIRKTQTLSESTHLVTDIIRVIERKQLLPTHSDGVVLRSNDDETNKRKRI